MATFHPYLNFNGNTEEAFNFYKSAIGGDFAQVMRFKDAPGGGGVPESDGDKIMHIALPLGNGTILMGTDAGGNMDPVIMGNNFSISVAPESEEEAYKLFDALSAGGDVKMPLSKQFWGDTFGWFVDKFGVKWMVNYQEKNCSNL